MSKNGHVVSPFDPAKASSNQHPGSKTAPKNSARARLDGNIARRAVRASEFFWWDTELPGFGLRTFPGGAKELVRSVPAARQAEAGHAGASGRDERDRHAHGGTRASDPVFWNKLTRRPVRDIEAFWRDVKAEAGLPGVRLHDLRHSFASHAAARSRHCR